MEPGEQPYFVANLKKLKGFKVKTWRYRGGSNRFFSIGHIGDDREKNRFFYLQTTFFYGNILSVYPP